MAMDYRRMMQEKLDGELDAQTQEALHEHLQKDEQAAEEHAKLESLHDKLATAPAMRAPSRLAATIMARLAKTVEAQAELEPMPQEVQMALMLTVSIVQMMMMPVMLAASYMVLNVQYSPQLLTRVMERSVALIVMMIDALVILLEEVERMIEKDPEMARVAMSLIPVALMGMIDYIQEENSDIDNGVA
ncbi:MAG: hypothetical protein Phog2KO_37020 [Phototrophicaceae bacterium]